MVGIVMMRMTWVIEMRVIPVIIVVIPARIIGIIVRRIPMVVITCRCETPIPPQRIGECRESVGIRAIDIHIPVKRRSTIHHVKIEGTGDMDGYLRAGKAHKPNRVLIIRLRAIEAVDPALVLIGIGD